MISATCIRAAVALMLGVAAAAAQETLDTRGAWRIVANGDGFALRTPAIGAEGTLSLLCRKEPRVFAFEIKSAALANRPPHEEVRVGYTVDDGDQTWFTLRTGPEGTVPISHQTAFWIIHPALSRSDAKQVAFTAGGHTWPFSLEGFAGLTESLNARCGFEPPRTTPQRR